MVPDTAVADLAGFLDNQQDTYNMYDGRYAMADGLHIYTHTT